MKSLMENKTPEERKAIAAKAKATMLKNKEALVAKRAESLATRDWLQMKIDELTRRLEVLQRADVLNIKAARLTGKALLTEEKIVDSSSEWSNVSGVYFLVKEKRVVYVGQARSVFARIGQHVDKDFDRVAFIQCDECALDHIESMYIHMLRPPINADMQNGGKVAPIGFGELLNIRGGR